MKKVLALVVAFALCFTVFAGCFATSAAAVADSFKVVGSTVEAAGGAATVTVSGAYDAKTVQLLTVTLPEGVTFVSVDGMTQLTADGTNGDYVVNGQVIKFLTIADSTFSIVINVTVPANETAEDVTYNVAAAVEFAAFDDTAVSADKANGNITVKAKVVEPEGPVLDPNLTFASVSLGYGTSSLQMSFRVNNTILDSYADMELVIVPQKYDLTTLNLVETPSEIVVNKANLAKAGSTRKQYIHTDIYLYELGLNIDYMLRAYDAEGNLVAVSETFTTSAATFLKSTYAGSSDAKLRTLIADTLVVGDEAMKNTAASYTNSDLAAASSIIEGFDTSEATQTVSEYNTINQFNSYNADYTTANSAVHQIKTSVQIGKVPFINFRIADANKVLDFEKLVLTVSYTSKDSSGEHPYSREFTGSDFTYAGKYINCKFDEVGLHDSDKDILFTVKYDGETVCDLTYSIETYLGSMTSNASVGALTTALIKLGQSFRSYQGL